MGKVSGHTFENNNKLAEVVVEEEKLANGDKCELKVHDDKVAAVKSLASRKTRDRKRVVAVVYLCSWQ